MFQQTGAAAFSRSRAGGNLRHLIGLHDLRQAHVAKYLEISPTGLAHILRGRYVPTLATASRAAAAFGITVDELCGERTRCLLAAVVVFDSAPIRAVALDWLPL
jgi:transcriptional regulator with XRE-family HTH domain